MPQENLLPVRKIIWRNILFFAITTLIGIVVTPLYVFRCGISFPEWLLFGFYILVTPLCITMGYHRLFAHKSYKIHPFMQFLFLFFGAAAFEQSALKWASQHRIHHRYVDTERDPYSIQKGFFYAHIGWLIFWKHPEDYSNVRDLQQNRLLMHQHQYYGFWAIGAGILLPLWIGALTGHFWGALLLGVCTRLTLVYHATFCINSVCHTFGKATYDIYSSAKDHWFTALLTYGEGYHNYHHHFPGDYRNGVRWYHWDPTKWLITLLAWTGLAQDLKKISPYKILAARLRAQHQRAEDVFTRIAEDSKLKAFRQKLKEHYEQLKQRLIDWEQNREAKRPFQETLREWKILYSQALRLVKPVPLQC